MACTVLSALITSLCLQCLGCRNWWNLCSGTMGLTWMSTARVSIGCLGFALHGPRAWMGYSPIPCPL